ncbi:hypothetical protein GCM10009827_091180 [Dactylosporangium maewongense]|uniref:Rieske domain-containing protein n=1 Tax=Dactylosporangium maewongense TaxID=634393 RepID=A0ABP4N927_9ACTN
MRVLARLENARWLDRIGDAVRRVVLATVGKGQVGEALHGRQLGHPAHPAMVQLPVGAWMSAAVLDLLPGTEPAATALLVAGTAGTLPSVATGAADFGTLSREQRRVALVHAAANTVAVGLFTASIVARLRGDHRRGRALSFAGLGVAGTSAYLGGHLAFAQAAGVNHAAAALPRVPRDWQTVDSVDSFADRKVGTRAFGDTTVLVYRESDRFSVMVGECAHRGGPLTDGRTVDVDGQVCVQCPWHGSVFALADGHAVHGPAGSDQVLLRTRVRGGLLEATRP